MISNGPGRRRGTTWSQTGHGQPLHVARHSRGRQQARRPTRRRLQPRSQDIRVPALPRRSRCRSRCLQSELAWKSGSPAFTAAEKSLTASSTMNSVSGRGMSGGRNQKIETPELANAHNVGGRLAALAPGYPFGESRLERWRYRARSFREQPRPIPAEYGARIHIDVDRRVGVGDARGTQPRAPL